MATFSIDKTKANIGDTVNLSASGQSSGIANYTMWVADFTQADMERKFYDYWTGDYKSSVFGKISKKDGNDNVVISIGHTGIETLTPIHLYAQNNNMLNSGMTNTLNYHITNSTGVITIGDTVNVDFTTNLYFKLKKITSHWFYTKSEVDAMIDQLRQELGE